MNIGFPEFSDSYLVTQDIFHTQYNDVEFYVEDLGAEHLYYNLIVKLFPNLTIGKIFPLNGKINVIADANLNIGNKKKVYLVDLDFDHILGIMENLDNLFYLDQHSIENYLFSKSSVYELIRNKYPTWKDIEIEKYFDFSSVLKLAALCLGELASSCAIIQKYNLGICHYNLDIKRDFNFIDDGYEYKSDFIKNYLSTINKKLIILNQRFNLKSQSKEIEIYYDGTIESLKNIPGKNILKFIKDRLMNLKLINQVSEESFAYTLSKESNCEKLHFLKDNILEFLEN